MEEIYFLKNNVIRSFSCKRHGIHPLLSCSFERFVKRNIFTCKSTRDEIFVNK